MIKRDIDDFLEKRMFSGKTLVIYGPRQAGKTTVVENYIARHHLEHTTLTFNGDEAADREILADVSAERLKLLIGNRRVLFIDEAHKIPEIGLVLKRAWDKIKAVQVVASGSSSVELADKIEEPMTGRKFDYTLMPLSFAELAANSSPMEEMRERERRMLYGSYPDIVTHPGDEVARLRELGKGYLYKDILKYEDIKRPEILDKIVRALAYQIGQEVVYSEIAHLVGTDDKTVSRYVDILEKAFVVRKVASFSRNLRNELKKSKKIYFTDCGIRNYVIGDWRPLIARSGDEVGHLWENYLISERAKWRLVHEPETRDFFWRTVQQQEVDLVEETAAGLRGYELKLDPKKAAKKISKTFTTSYPEAVCCGVSVADYDEFLMGRVLPKVSAS